MYVCMCIQILSKHKLCSEKKVNTQQSWIFITRFYYPKYLYKYSVHCPKPIQLRKHPISKQTKANQHYLTMESIQIYKTEIPTEL